VLEGHRPEIENLNSAGNDQSAKHVQEKNTPSSSMST
jgi:hypothetical protein